LFGLESLAANSEGFLFWANKKRQLGKFFPNWRFAFGAKNCSQAAQCTCQGGELEGPSDPDPFGLENQEGNHADRAHEENHPVTAFVVGVFFVLFHDFDCFF
jgi:hypothetical protein